MKATDWILLAIIVAPAAAIFAKQCFPSKPLVRATPRKRR